MSEYTDLKQEIDEKVQLIEKIQQLPEEFRRPYLEKAGARLYSAPVMQIYANLINTLLNTFFLIIMILLCIMSIYVVSSRIELVALVDEQLSSTNAKIADQMQAGQDQFTPSPAGLTEEESEVLIFDMQVNIKKKYNIERIKRGIMSIVADGDKLNLNLDCLRSASLHIDNFASSQSLRKILPLTCREIENSIYISMNNSISEIATYSVDTPIDFRSFVLDWLSAAHQFFHSMSNLLLLAIGTISAAGIGAVSAELRRRETADLSKLAVGLASGFIAFLAIKGGRFLLVAPGQYGNIELNPYGMLLVGVLVGLFSDRAYAFTSSLIDDLADRLATTKKSESDGIAVEDAGVRPKAEMPANPETTQKV